MSSEESSQASSIRSTLHDGGGVPKSINEMPVLNGHRSRLSRYNFRRPSETGRSQRSTSRAQGDIDDDDDEANNNASIDSHSLNRILTERFDVEDAMRLESNIDGAKTGQPAINAEDEGQQYEDGGQIVSKVFTNRSTGHLDLPPDGGYGWVCCICVTLIMFSTWGSNSAFGVYLAYYLNNGVFPGASKYDYAIIAGLTVALGQGLAPISTLLMRLWGLKIPMYIGIIFLFAGFMLASFATKLWQLYLTQGVLVGIGISLSFAPATTVLPGWFLKKRSACIGISFMGTGAGGVTYTLAVNKLIQETGHQNWPLRMMAIACAITCLVSAILVKQRIPLKPTGSKSWLVIKQQFQLTISARVAKMYSVNLVAAWFTLSLFGYNLMVFTLSPYAVARGLSPHQASILTTALNAAQTLGRPAMGLLGDRFGRMNVTVILTVTLTIFLFAFWLPSHTFIQLLFFSICVGACIGVANVMSTVLVADFVQPSDFIPAWSYVMGSGAPALLVCEVVAQALTTEKNPTNPYIHTQIFAGLCFFCALLLVLLLREYSVRKKLESKINSFDSWVHHENSHDGISEKECSSHDRELGKNRLRERDLVSPGLKNYFRRMCHPMKV
ncbi:LAMI_0B01838g1_1 [Lachancea mirantina]|uniref:LAMI_0B01838g1_1 n=1 Tax=Lachancea mirantina TaxID=1230905 RepID=A0A1G4IUB4_9SACH|nr:LAMI_0B01838g1_1 [Lachancea mirantina]